MLKNRIAYILSTILLLGATSSFAEEIVVCPKQMICDVAGSLNSCGLGNTAWKITGEGDVKKGLYILQIGFDSGTFSQCTYLTAQGTKLYGLTINDPSLKHSGPRWTKSQGAFWCGSYGAANCRFERK